jgi:hypothetical protein
MTYIIPRAHDSDFVDGIHGWRWRILDFIQREEPQSSSASRFAAGAFGFLTLSQSGDGPRR